MAGRKFRSKLLWGFLSVVLLLVLLIAALPLWFPLALRPIAKRFGATYADYQRIGYQRFEVSGFTLTNSSLQIQVGRATAFVPSVWLWRRYSNATNEPFLSVASWSYAPAATKSSASSAPVSVYPIFENIKNLAITLDNWLPRATLSNGIVTIGRENLEIPQAHWSSGTLLAQVLITNQPPPIDLTLSTERSKPWRLEFDWGAQQLHSAVSIADRDERLAVNGTADWLTNHFQLGAEFASQGVLPQTASLRADSFNVPAHLVGLEPYDDITGALHADWQTNRFNAQLTAIANPQSNNIPPLNIQLHATGDTNAAQLDLVNVSGPGLQASLPKPATIEFQPPFLTQPTTLDASADLDQLSKWVGSTASEQLQGRLTGKADVYPTDRVPRIVFTLSGTGVTTTSITTSNLALDGELDWPVVNLKSAQVQMDDGSHISLAGAYDLKQKIVRDGRLQSTGPFGGQFLPADYSFASASLIAQFAGPLNSLTNSAKCEVKRFGMPHLNPLDIEAIWGAEGLNLKNAQIKFTSGNSSLQLGGSGSLAAKRTELTLTAFELSTNNQPILHLRQRAQILWEAAAGTNSSWGLNVTPLALIGDGQDFQVSASLNWPHYGTFASEAHGLEARLLKNFIPQANAEAMLNHFSLSGGWTNGPITFQLASDATLETKERLPFSANAILSGGQTGIVIEQLSVSTTNKAVCRVEGSLPIFCDPTRADSKIQVATEAPLKLQMTTDPNSVLWEKIAAATGLRLQEPNLAANLEGTWAAPKGQVTMQVQRIELASPQHPLPAVENVDFVAIMDRASAQISKCNFEIENQPVTLTGQLPLGESFWSRLRHQRSLPDWHDATGHLTMQNAQLAAFATFLPQILSAQGTMSADISLERGGNLRGQISVQNARTHPLATIGPVRNIQAVARLDGRTMRLENASAEIGGQRVNADANFQLNEPLWQIRAVPPFQAHLTGTNVPLARNPSVLLRADLDLTATNSGSGAPVVSGTVKLRNSLYLAELQSLVPESTKSPEQRPPYFSIPIDPWSRWRLKVNVAGNSFLRVQTPIFQGTVSAVLTMEGTLKEPVALGQVRIDTGSVVSFPFSTLDVKQGFVSLTSENPYRPALFLQAEAKRFGYDVKMEVTGPVDQPVIQFSSIPSLSSEEIVLMLTSGQIPAGLGVTTTMEQRAQGLALFVGKNLLSDFGLSSAGQERLTIRSGEYISESGKTTYQIEYKVTDRWSVIGEYDRFDQYNLNVKWKVYSK